MPSRRSPSQHNAALPVMSMERNFVELLTLGPQYVANAFLCVPDGRVAAQRANRMLVLGASTRYPSGATRNTILDKFLQTGGHKAWYRRRALSAARAACVARQREREAVRELVTHSSDRIRCWCRTETSYITVRKSFGAFFDCPVCLRERVDDEDHCVMDGCNHVVCTQCAQELVRVAKNV